MQKMQGEKIEEIYCCGKMIWLCSSVELPARMTALKDHGMTDDICSLERLGKGLSVQDAKIGPWQRTYRC